MHFLSPSWTFTACAREMGKATDFPHVAHAICPAGDLKPSSAVFRCPTPSFPAGTHGKGGRLAPGGRSASSQPDHETPRVSSFAGNHASRPLPSTRIACKPGSPKRLSLWEAANALGLTYGLSCSDICSCLR